jgi:hypothetical protein
MTYLTQTSVAAVMCQTLGVDVDNFYADCLEDTRVLDDIEAAWDVFAALMDESEFEPIPADVTPPFPSPPAILCSPPPRPTSLTSRASSPCTRLRLAHLHLRSSAPPASLATPAPASTAASTSTSASTVGLL